MADTDLNDLHVPLGPRSTVPETERTIRLDDPRGPKGDFARLWAATAISNIGDGVRITALPLLAAVMTRDPILVAGVLMATRIPWLLFSLHSGAIADRTDRKRLVVLVNVLRAAVMGLLAISVVTGTGGLVALYLVAFLQGIGEVFSDNTAFALLPSVVGKEQLERANGRLEAAIIVTNEFAGPALGALLFAASASLPFALDALTFALAAWLFAGMRLPTRTVEPPTTSVTEDIKDGLKWLRAHLILRDLTVIASLTNLSLQATFAIQVLFVLDVLGLSFASFGVLVAAQAGGSIVGSFVASPLRERIGLRSTVLISLGLAAGANLVIATTSSWVVAGAMWIVISATGTIWSIVTNSFRQRSVPDDLLARVQSAHRLFSWGAIPLGALLGGLMAKGFGLRAPFLVAGLALSLLSIAAVRLLPSERPVSITLDR